VEPLAELGFQVVDQATHAGCSSSSRSRRQSRAAAKLVRGVGHVRGWRRWGVGPDGGVTLRWNWRRSRSGATLEEKRRHLVWFYWIGRDYFSQVVTLRLLLSISILITLTGWPPCFAMRSMRIIFFIEYSVLHIQRLTRSCWRSS